MTAGQLINRWNTGRRLHLSARWRALVPSLVSWALVFLLAYLLANLAWRVVGIWLDRDATAPEAVVVSPGMPSANTGAASAVAWNEYRLFGKEPAAGTAPVAAKKKASERRRPAPKKPVRLTLYGTVAATDPEDAMAVVSADGKPAEIYRPGDELRTGVVLKSVEPWSIVVLVGEQEQFVYLVEESQITRTVQPAPIVPAAPGEPGKADETRITSPEVVAKIAEYRQALAANPMALMNKVRAYAVRRDGQLYGYRLRPGTDRALLGEMGLRSGDILISLNGVAVNEAQNLPDIMANLKDQPEILMQLERGGQRQELRVVMETAE